MGARIPPPPRILLIASAYRTWRTTGIRTHAIDPIRAGAQRSRAETASRQRSHPPPPPCKRIGPIVKPNTPTSCAFICGQANMPLLKKWMQKLGSQRKTRRAFGVLRNPRLLASQFKQGPGHEPKLDETQSLDQRSDRFPIRPSPHLSNII